MAQRTSRDWVLTSSVEVVQSVHLLSILIFSTVRYCAITRWMIRSNVQNSEPQRARPNATIGRQSYCVAGNSTGK